jgi:protein-disulfide isomerase
MNKVAVSLVVLSLVAILSFFIIKDNKISEKEVKSVVKDQENTNEAAAMSLIDESEAKEILSSPERDSALLVSNSDIVHGIKDAKVTIIEYASLSCSHCAAFYKETFPKIKQEYIDKGKVKFIYRDFPLNFPALTASIVSKCYARSFNGDKKSIKYYKFIEALFKTQDSWAFDEKYLEKLESISKLSGMSAGEFSKCVQNKDIKDEILRERLSASKILEISSTPTFFINGEKIDGYSGYQKMKLVIEKQLSQIQ